MVLEMPSENRQSQGRGNMGGQLIPDLGCCGWKRFWSGHWCFPQWCRYGYRRGRPEWSWRYVPWKNLSKIQTLLVVQYLESSCGNFEIDSMAHREPMQVLTSTLNLALRMIHEVMYLSNCGIIFYPPYIYVKYVPEPPSFIQNAWTTRYLFAHRTTSIQRVPLQCSTSSKRSWASDRLTNISCPYSSISCSSRVSILLLLSLSLSLSLSLPLSLSLDRWTVCFILTHILHLFIMYSITVFTLKLSIFQQQIYRHKNSRRWTEYCLFVYPDTSTRILQYWQLVDRIIQQVALQYSDGDPDVAPLAMDVRKLLSQWVAIGLQVLHD